MMGDIYAYIEENAHDVKDGAYVDCQNLLAKAPRDRRTFGSISVRVSMMSCIVPESVKPRSFC